jgi:hypothetical protein
VLDVVLRAKHRLLPISHQNPVTSRSVDLSLRPADLALGEGQAAPRRTLETLSVVRPSEALFLAPSDRALTSIRWGVCFHPG